ncbi:hypothetical protein HaLaN_02205 [Haematococcus lacustris]|uniref:Uncharacterized protein n=1 Tax=Haematococcus lacustris TaxID=44745 RepID=A0A699YDC9_HAELA|nr:hypothetical protein HaLaN_02205 [Haematococcus lacustris]
MDNDFDPSQLWLLAEWILSPTAVAGGDGAVWQEEGLPPLRLPGLALPAELLSPQQGAPPF